MSDEFTSTMQNLPRTYRQKRDVVELDRGGGEDRVATSLEQVLLR